MELIKSKRGSALLFDCGKGKTVTTLTAIDELISELDCKGVLIVSTLRVARLVWPLECEKWDHLNWLKVKFIHGTPKQRIKALNSHAQVYTTNYENLIWLVDKLFKVHPSRWPFDTIVFDELTKMKNSKSKRHKKIKKILRHFKRRIGLTGTITPKGLIDLFGQMYVLDEGRRLGSSLKFYQQRYFDQDDYDGYKFTPKDWAEDAIKKRIRDIILIEQDDGSDRPTPEMIEVELELTAKLKADYKELEDELFLEIDDDEIEAFNAASLSNKCLQFASGAVYMDEVDDVEETITKKVIDIHDIKMKKVKEIRDSHKGEPVLITYSYQHERDRLIKMFPKAVVLKSGLTDEQELDIQKRWDAGKISELICHPASAGHGLNFQYGGRIVIWTTLNWSLELYIQLNKRVDRQGQTKKALIYQLVMLDTVDEVVLTTLNQRDQDQTALLTALKLYRDSKMN